MAITISLITAGSTHISGNPIWVKGTTSGIPAGATDYKILLQVISDEMDGSPFTPDAIAPDAANEALFNISGIVDAPISRDFQWPLVNKFTAHPELVYEISLRAGESYYDSNGVLQENFEADFNPVYIIKGRIPNMLQAELNDAGKNYFEYFATEKRFISLMPKKRTVSPYQPLKVWYKSALATDVQKTLTITGYYDNGPNEIKNHYFTASPGALYEIDALPSLVEIPVDTGTKKLMLYTVQLNDTETLNFNVDWGYYEKYYYLFVDNRIGGIECIWLKGRRKYLPTGSRTLSRVPHPRGAGVKVPTLKVSGNTRQRKWVFNSGYYSKAELEAFDILLDAPNAWLAVPPANGETALTNYKIVPVIITNTELQLSDDMEDVESIDIELTEAM